MKKITIAALMLLTALLVGCMSPINPISGTTAPIFTQTLGPTVDVTTLPTADPNIKVRAYGILNGEEVAVKCEFSARGSFAYGYFSEIPELKRGDAPEGFTELGEDNIINEVGKNLVIAQLDDQGKIFNLTVFKYITGISYFEDKEYIALINTVTNTDKQDFSFGYGEVSLPLFAKSGDGVNAGINYYCHEHQPFYSPADGEVIAAENGVVNLYIQELDATLCVAHLLDIDPAVELIGTRIEAGALLGYTGGVGPSGFPEMHLELLAGRREGYAGYTNPIETVRMLAYDVRLLFDQRDAVRTDNPQYIPYNVNAGGNAGYGLAARENGYIYFLNPEDGNRIYRMKNDGTEQEKITSDRAKFLTVCEGWVYYSSPGNGLHFFRSKVDGSAREKLYETSMSNFTILGDTIYMETVTSSERLHVLKNDGSGYTRISSGKVRSPFYYKGLLYTCAVRSDMQVYTTKEYLSDEGELAYSYDKLKGIRATNIVAVDDKLYFANADDEDKLYCANLDGTEETLLYDATVADINIYNGYLYFTNVGDYSRVYRCALDGSDSGAIMNTSYCCNLSIAGDWLFYNINNDTGNAYRYNLITGESVKVK
ncbi:MAG: DUF5050 domain-containing protein [Clostridia bacterium]|nr:DUF5050 domain-containing protein [Clostridia bacterium]